jgi:hypothetical protein
MSKRDYPQKHGKKPNQGTTGIGKVKARNLQGRRLTYKALGQKEGKS